MGSRGLSTCFPAAVARPLSALYKYTINMRKKQMLISHSKFEALVGFEPTISVPLRLLVSKTRPTIGPIHIRGTPTCFED